MRDTAIMNLGLTATALVTEPMDFTHIGHMLGVLPTMSLTVNERAVLLRSKIQNLSTRINKALKDELHNLVQSGTIEVVSTAKVKEQRAKILEGVENAKQEFQGRIIRRTSSTSDSTGHPINPLPLLTEIDVWVTLSPKHIMAIREVTTGMIDKENASGDMFGVRVLFFSFLFFSCVAFFLTLLLSFF